MDLDTVEINVVVRRRPGMRCIEVTGDVDHCGTPGLRRALQAAAGRVLEMP